MYLDDEALALEFVLLAEGRELRRVAAFVPCSVRPTRKNGEEEGRGDLRGAFMSVPGSLRSFELLVQ